jgi:hypothetical protein
VSTLKAITTLPLGEPTQLQALRTTTPTAMDPTTTATTMAPLTIILVLVVLDKLLTRRLLVLVVVADKCSQTKSRSPFPGFHHRRKSAIVVLRAATALSILL